MATVEIPPPRDASGVAIAIVGTIAWAIGCVTLVVAGESLLPSAVDEARQVALAGTLLGLVGIPIVLVRRARSRR